MSLINGFSLLRNEKNNSFENETNKVDRKLKLNLIPTRFVFYFTFFFVSSHMFFLFQKCNISALWCRPLD